MQCLLHHITPVLQSLHWLPVEKRIQYKILLLTYKCLHARAPTYLSDLLTCQKNLRKHTYMELALYK